MFIILGAGRPHIGSIHASLKKFSHSHRVLDWKLNIIKSFSKNILFVGGNGLCCNDRPMI